VIKGTHQKDEAAITGIKIPYENKFWPKSDKRFIGPRLSNAVFPVDAYLGTLWVPYLPVQVPVTFKPKNGDGYTGMSSGIHLPYRNGIYLYNCTGDSAGQV
jgi:hypothetical protein